MNDSHDTTSGSSTGVTGLQRVGVTTGTEIVSSGVNDHGSADDGVWADERNVLVCKVGFDL